MGATSSAPSTCDRVVSREGRGDQSTIISTSDRSWVCTGDTREKRACYGAHLSSKEEPAKDRNPNLSAVDNYPDLVMDWITGQKRHAGIDAEFESAVYIGRGHTGPSRRGPPPRIQITWESLPWCNPEDPRAGLPDPKYMSVVSPNNAYKAATMLAKYHIEDPLFKTNWKGVSDAPTKEARFLAIQQIFTCFVKHAMASNSILEIDNCQGVMMTVPVTADSQSSVAPGPGIFAQLKPHGDWAGASSGMGTIADPPASVLTLAHLKARRLQGRSYIYLWAMAVNLDRTELSQEHQMAYLSALIEYVMAAADRDNFPVVTEVSSEKEAELMEKMGVREDGTGGFQKCESLIINDKGVQQTWYLMVRPERSYHPADYQGMCGPVRHTAQPNTEHPDGQASKIRYCGAPAAEAGGCGRPQQASRPVANWKPDNTRFDLEGQGSFGKVDTFVPTPTPRGLTSSASHHHRPVHVTNFMV